MPTFGGFREALEQEFDCSFKQIVIPNVNNESFPIDYFERTVEGKKYLCVVSIENDNEVVTPSVLRSVCKRLKIDPAEFGLHLG